MFGKNNLEVKKVGKITYLISFYKIKNVILNKNKFYNF